MPSALNGTFLTKSSVSVPAIAPVGIVSAWQEAIAAGACNVQDASTVTSVAALLADAKKTILKRTPTAGTTIVGQLRYKTSGTTAGNFQVAFFGSTDGQAWERLKTRAGTASMLVAISPTTDPVDPNDTTYSVSTVDITQAVDCLSCEDIVCGVEAVVAGANAASATFRLKLL